MALRIIVGDVETSGLDQDAGIVEIAWTEVDEHFNVLDSKSSLIDPQVRISPAASGVHGITDKDVEFAPTIAQFMEMTGYPFEEGEIILVAHNAPFDSRFFKPLINNFAGTLCTLKMARLIYPESDDHKLQTLRYYLGLGGGDAHSAAGDVEVAVNLLRRMCIDTDCSLFDLFERSKHPVMIDLMPFGKHKGTPLTELPKGYVKWLMGLDSLDENLRWSLNQL